MIDRLTKLLETFNNMTNVIALIAIFVGAGLAIHKDAVTGGSLVTGGFAILSKKDRIQETTQTKELK